MQTEDLIGLKIQAAINDDQRAAADWADIRGMIEVTAQTGATLDWELIAE